MDMIEWLYSLQHFGIKLGLDNIRRLLELLGHPERAYPSILVAGTNGKGSVAVTIHSLLGASGVRAGLFTSPHLIRPTERIRIGDDDIEPDELERHLARMRETIENGLTSGALETHPSFFEVITATALAAFREHSVGAAVLEVGLGGRLDATNAVDADLAVVVGIDLDHTKTLGESPAKITGEKAGIVKRGKPVVSGVVQPEAIEVLARTCRERDARRIDARAAVRLSGESTGAITLETDRARYRDLELALAGRHQVDNARVALAAFEEFCSTLELVPTTDAVRTGFGSVRWPGRLQWTRAEGFAPDLLFDGAHNPAGARGLTAYLETLSGPAPVMVFGAKQGKLIEPMLAALAPRVHAIVITQTEVQRSADPVEVAQLARERFDRVEVLLDPDAALRRAAELAGDRRFVLVCGSLYLVGDILGRLELRPVAARMTP